MWKSGCCVTFAEPTLKPTAGAMPLFSSYCGFELLAQRQLPVTTLPVPIGVPLGYQLSTFQRLRELLMMFPTTVMFREVSEPTPLKITPEPLSSIALCVIRTFLAAGYS